jgi:hypothetical protein
LGQTVRDMAMTLGADSAPLPTAGVWKGKGVQFSVSDDGKYITNSITMTYKLAKIIKACH